jgi:hypothetical protein
LGASSSLDSGSQVGSLKFRLGIYLHIQAHTYIGIQTEEVKSYKFQKTYIPYIYRTGTHMTASLPMLVLQMLCSFLKFQIPEFRGSNKGVNSAVKIKLIQC